MIKLDGIWDFAFCESDRDIPVNFPSAAIVPGCFDVSADHAGKRGVGFYRQFIRLKSDMNYCLHLLGISHNARVYLNRVFVGSHHGGFTAFSVDFQPDYSGVHELIISADNRFDGLNRPLHMPHFDWYSYGGIIRSVLLEEWNEVLIKNIRPTIVNWKTGSAKLRIFLCPGIAVKLPLELKILYDNIILKTHTLDEFRSPLDIEIQIPSAKPWTPENPYLYKIDVDISNARKSVHLGFREIRTQGSQIILNDEPIRLRGVNRHDSTVQFGFAIPPALHLYDVQKIRELGCNFVRTSHYPPDHSFLDLCDRTGLLVWCEPTAWQYDNEMMKDERTLSAQRQCITEMIEQYAHHPSIICWGLLNECDSTSPAARPVYESLVGLIRELDPSRPVTYASCYFSPAETFEETRVTDRMFDLVDWISLNIYPGWYSGGPEDCLERMDHLLKRFDEMHYGKPLIISEIGAGGIPHFDHFHPVKWSLSYQDILMERLIEYIRRHPVINGVAIWHYADILTCDDVWKKRPRQYNNKGLLDEFRLPKPVFHTIKKIYHMQW